MRVFSFFSVIIFSFMHLLAFATSPVTYSSAEELPNAFKLPVPKCSELNVPQLNELKFSANRDEDFFVKWSSDQIEKSNYLIIEGSNFLKFEDTYAKSNSMKLYDSSLLASKQITRNNLILGLYWDTYVRSASLINRSHPKTKGLYGYVLEIPPQLILRVWPWDAGTATIDHKLDNPSHWVQEGILNQDHDKFGIHYFPDPDQLLRDGQDTHLHNEIKFVPQGDWCGKGYSVTIRGLFAKDEQVASQIQEISALLNLEFYKL